MTTDATSPGPLDAPRRRLARVLVSPQRVVRTIVGLRPFRPSGFRVEAEPLGDTLLVHNYGHGGSGVTLSWGTASLAIDRIVESGRGGPVAVIGCGAVGLATARLLQTRGFEVTIHARALPPDTTSNVAGALWYPHLIVDEARRTAAFDAQFESAARFSHRYFQGLVGDDYGVCWRQQYFLSRAPAPDSWDIVMLRDLFPESRPLRPGEHPFGVPHVVVDRMMFIEPAVYLEALLRDFRLAGGRVQNPVVCVTSGRRRAAGADRGELHWSWSSRPVRRQRADAGQGTTDRAAAATGGRLRLDQR